MLTARETSRELALRLGCPIFADPGAAWPIPSGHAVGLARTEGRLRMAAVQEPCLGLEPQRERKRSRTSEKVLPWIFCRYRVSLANAEHNLAVKVFRPPVSASSILGCIENTSRSGPMARRCQAKLRKHSEFILHAVYGACYIIVLPWSERPYSATSRPSQAMGLSGVWSGNEDRTVYQPGQLLTCHGRPAPPATLPLHNPCPAVYLLRWGNEPRRPLHGYLCELGSGTCALQPMMRPAAMAGTNSSSSNSRKSPVSLLADSKPNCISV